MRQPVKRTTITVLDLQDSASQWNGVSIDDEEALAKLLEESRKKKPFFIELKGDNGYKLIVGIGGPEGCVQFSSSNGEPPYLLAVTPGRAERNDGMVEFFAGDQPSEIPVRQCLPFEALRQIVLYFFENGVRCMDFVWEEV